MPSLVVRGLLGGSLVLGGLSAPAAPPASAPSIVVRGLLGGSLVTGGLGAGTPAPPAAAGTFLKALTDYLEAAPPILALLDDAPRVYVERAGTNAVAPYVLVEGVRLAPDPEGIPGDELATLEVNAYAPTPAAARRLGGAIVAAVDPISLNDASTRAGPLTWAGGREDLALRTGGRLYKIPGGAFGLRANWARTNAYEFRIRDDEGGPVTPDDPFVPDHTPGSLAGALAGYLIAAPDLTAALGGAAKVYLDETTASGVPLPYLVLEDVQDDDDGEADEEGDARLSVVVQAKTLRAASAIHRLVRDLIDPPGMSGRGRRAAAFAWEGGAEEACLWRGSALHLRDGAGPGGVDVWSWAADYEFMTRDT